MKDSTGKFICSYPACGKSFKRKFDWGRHLDTHLYSQFQCQHCEKTFTRQGGLNAHLQTCKVAKTKNLQPQSEDASIIGVQDVLPVKLDFEKQTCQTYDKPQKNNLERTAWIATGRNQSTNRAIKLLSKYDHKFEPAIPAVPRAALNHLAKPLPCTSRMITPLSNQASGLHHPTVPPQAGTRTSSLPNMHTSDIRPAKHVSFNDSHTLIPPAPASRTACFVPPTSNKRLMSTFMNRPCDHSPMKMARRGHYKLELVESPQATPTSPARSPSRVLTSKPLIIPLECSLDQDDPRTPPVAASVTAPTKAPPQWDPKTNMDGPGGSPFITEPDNEQTL